MASMLGLGCLVQLLPVGGSIVYGVLFLLLSGLTAVWVRPDDLVTAPIVVPIAFTVGQLPLLDDEGGVMGALLGLVTALAVEAGWLYGGTLVAGVVVTVRKIRLMRRRTAQEFARATAAQGRGQGAAQGAPRNGVPGRRQAPQAVRGGSRPTDKDRERERGRDRQQGEEPGRSQGRSRVPRPAERARRPGRTA